MTIFTPFCSVSYYLILTTYPHISHYTLIYTLDDCRQQLVRMKVRGTAVRKAPAVAFTEDEDTALLDAVRQATGMPGTYCVA